MDESFIENILPTKYLYGRIISVLNTLYEPFSSLQLNWDMKCILIGLEASKHSGNIELFWQYNLFCTFILGEISEVRSALE